MLNLIFNIAKFRIVSMLASVCNVLLRHWAHPIICTVANLLKWTFLLSLACDTDALLGPLSTTLVSPPCCFCFFRFDLSWGRSDMLRLDIFWGSFFLDIFALKAPPNSLNILERPPEMSGPMLTVSMYLGAGLRAGLLLWALLLCSGSTLPRSRLLLLASAMLPWPGWPPWWPPGPGWPGRPGPWLLCRHTELSGGGGENFQRSSWDISGGNLQTVGFKQV